MPDDDPRVKSGISPGRMSEPRPGREDYYELETDYAPAYECYTSLLAFFNKQNHHVLDEGKLWVREVQKRFSSEKLEAMKEAMKADNDFCLPLFIWSCPFKDSVRHFLDWFQALGAGDLFELYGRYSESIPANLPGLRDRMAAALGDWEEGYFRHVGPEVSEALSREAMQIGTGLKEDDPMALYEKLTFGMRLYPGGAMRRVVLIPQYHARPLVISSECGSIAFTSYAVDCFPPQAGRPAQGLLRLTKALSDETRLMMLRMLAGERRTFTEIAKEIGVSKSTVHYHLITLRAAGLVTLHLWPDKVAETKYAEYSLRHEGLETLPLRLDHYLAGPGE